MVNADKVARRIAAVGLELKHQLDHDAMTDDCRRYLESAANGLKAAFVDIQAAISLATIDTSGGNDA